MNSVGGKNVDCFITQRDLKWKFHITHLSISVFFQIILVYSQVMSVCAMLIAEGMWQQMAMNSGATMQPGPYPERPGEPDCTYYLRTGLCRFGMSCRFNHPPDRNLVNIYFSKLFMCHISWISRYFAIIRRPVPTYIFSIICRAICDVSFEEFSLGPKPL
jgi:hypothetical protein